MPTPGAISTCGRLDVSANLHVINRISFLNIPEQLRLLAERIESGQIDAVSAVFVLGRSDGRVAVRGYGERTSALECIGWMHRALTYMTERSGIDSEQNLGPGEIC